MRLHKKVEYYGLPSMYIQYYLNPDKLPKSKKDGNNRVFFWQRTNITFREIKRYFYTKQIDGIIFKSDIDPNHAVLTPNKEEIKNYKIKFVDRSFEISN